MKCGDFSIAINAILRFSFSTTLLAHTIRGSFSFSIYHCNFACLDWHIAVRLFRLPRNIQCDQMWFSVVSIKFRIFFHFFHFVLDSVLFLFIILKREYQENNGLEPRFQNDNIILAKNKFRWSVNVYICIKNVHIRKSISAEKIGWNADVICLLACSCLKFQVIWHHSLFIFLMLFHVQFTFATQMNTKFPYFVVQSFLWAIFL